MDSWAVQGCATGRFVGRPKRWQLKAGPAARCQLDGQTKTGPTVTVGPASFKHWTAMAYRGVR